MRQRVEGSREQWWSRGGDGCPPPSHPRVSAAGTLKEMDGIGKAQRVAPGHSSLSRRPRTGPARAGERGVAPQIKASRAQGRPRQQHERDRPESGGGRGARLRPGPGGGRLGLPAL